MTRQVLFNTWQIIAIAVIYAVVGAFCIWAGYWVLQLLLSWPLPMQVFWIFLITVFGLVPAGITLISRLRS